MKVIKTIVKTRPNTDIRFYPDLPTDLCLETQQSQEKMLADGRIISIIKTTSEDQLTRTHVTIFASIDDCIYNRSLFNEFIKTELEYMANNGITETVSWAFEE
jgi:hypothetical protein